MQLLVVEYPGAFEVDRGRSWPYSGLRRNPAEVAEFLLLSIEPMIPRSSSRENLSRSAE
jgi:hypothetical protein